MQRLMKIDPTSNKNHKKAILAMNEINIDDLLEVSHEHYGHSPFAFERITLFLKFKEGMSIYDITDYLTEATGQGVHRNRWIGWSQPYHTHQSNNMMYDRWVEICDPINKLLARYELNIGDFTFETTYLPNRLKAIREALGLSEDDFSALIGTSNGEVIKRLESENPVLNMRGMGFRDWECMISRIKKTQLRKKNLIAEAAAKAKAPAKAEAEAEAGDWEATILESANQDDSEVTHENNSLNTDIGKSNEEPLDVS